jgi:hypothetical protein
MKMEQTECSETPAYKNSDAGELPRGKHTTLPFLLLVTTYNFYVYLIYNKTARLTTFGLYSEPLGNSLKTLEKS